MSGVEQERALLRAALRRGDLATAARAWSRLRVRGDATADDAAPGRAARAALGHAIRTARWRRDHEPEAPTASPSAGSAPRPAPAPWIAGIAAAFVVVAALAVLARQAAVSPASVAIAPLPSLAAAAAASAYAAGGGRGRTSETASPSPPPTAAAVATGSPSATPTVAPTPMPSPVPTPRPTPPPTVQPATSASPGPTFLGTRVPASSPPPSPSLLPGPLPSGYSRITVGVGDLVTRQPIEGACIAFGTVECGPTQPRTNALGVWWWDFPTGSIAGITWQVTVVKAGYQTFTTSVTTTGGDQQFIVPLVPAS